MRKSGFGAIVLRDVARRPVVETGASGPGYSGGAERLSERLFGRGPDAKKRIRSRVLRDVARRPSVETGASGPGYSGGAERLSERLFWQAAGCEKAVSGTLS